MEANNILISQSGEGKEIRVGDAKLFLKLYSEQTNNKFSITEYELPSNFPGPPAHKHKTFEHAWYVIEGLLSIEVEGKEMTLKNGDFVFIPKKVVHAFSNKSDSTVKLLVIDTPGGFEDYYDELQAASTDGKSPDPNTFREIQRKYDTYPPDHFFE